MVICIIHIYFLHAIEDLGSFVHLEDFVIEKLFYFFLCNFFFRIVKSFFIFHEKSEM